jgi:CRISPR-associated protein Csy1
MAYYAFLMLEMEDGNTLLSHIERDSPVAREVLTRKTAAYEELKAGFMRIKKSTSEPVTHLRIKQVYFPVDENSYHQLSILTPSVLMFKMKRQIDEIRFPSDAVKEVRNARREGRYSDSGYTTLIGLTEVGYGGTKPQNISLLNSKNRGRAYLLRSVPPELQRDYRHLPKRDFFHTHLRYRSFQENYDSLRNLLENDINNVHIREGRNRRIRVIFDEIVRIVWQLRSHDAGWSDGEQYNSLPRFQKIVLDSMYNGVREHHIAEVEMFFMSIARWIIEGYRATAKTNPPLLADQELMYVLRVVSETKEALL